MHHSTGGLPADNDNARFRGGYPALNVLAKYNLEAARAVWREIHDAQHQTHADAPPAAPGYNVDDTEAHSVPDGVEGADATVAPVTFENLAVPSRAGPDNVSTEMLHEVKPSVDDLLRLAGGVAWPWCGRRIKRDGKECWVGEPWRYFYCLLPHVPEKHVVTIGGLTFYTKAKVRRGYDGGLLVTYTDTNDVEQRPAYTAHKPRGGKRPKRGKAAAEAYVWSKPATPSPLQVASYQRPMSDEPALMPMYTPQLRRAPDALDPHGRFGVEEARAEIARYIHTAPPITYCQPGLPWKGAEFMGGISAPKETASTPAVNYVEMAGRPLSPVLEEVAARGTLESIGEEIRDKSKPATVRLDRLGKRLLLAEAKALVAANDNTAKKVAA